MNLNDPAMLRAQRDSARDIAVALENELAGDFGPWRRALKRRARTYLRANTVRRLAQIRRDA